MKTIAILLIIILFSITLIAQDIWEYVYNPYSYVDGYLREDVAKCSDGGYIFCSTGFVEDPENPGFNVTSFGITFKVDCYGNLEWYHQDIVSSNTLNKDYGLAVLTDGGIVTAVGPEYSGSCALIKRDNNGNLIWQINPEFSPHSLIGTDDGGVIAVGNAPWGDDNMKKFSSDGVLQWGKRIRASNLFSVIRSSESGYITTGRYDGQNYGDVAVAKTNTNGDTLWTKYLDGFNSTDEGKSVIETISGEIIVVGRTNWAGFIWKLDQLGNTLNLEIIDENIGWANWSANEYIDNSIITWGAGPDYNWILNRYDSELNYIDTMDPVSIGSGDKGFLTENEYLVYCQWPDLTVTKTLYQPTDNEEYTLPEIEINTLMNYPNPFNPTTTIEFSIQNESNIELTIFNIRGQKVKTLINSDCTNGNHSIMWDGVDESNNPVSSGIYLYKLKVNGKTEATKKCLLLK